MKTTLIIAATAVAGAILVSYLVRKKEAGASAAEPVPAKKSHHLTDVFAHAKSHVD